MEPQKEDCKADAGQDTSTHCGQAEGAKQEPRY